MRWDLNYLQHTKITEHNINATSVQKREREREREGETPRTGSLFQTLWDPEQAVFALRQKRPNSMRVQHLGNLKGSCTYLEINEIRKGENLNEKMAYINKN